MLSRSWGQIPFPQVFKQALRAETGRFLSPNTYPMSIS